MLIVSELQKSFRSPTGETIRVLNSVSFTASPGEAIAITGASGAGKSTLMHLLGGLERPDFGAVELNSISVNSEPSARLSYLRNSQIGFIFQFHHLLPDLSAAENVALPLMIAGEAQRSAIQKAKESLGHLGLGDRVDHPVTYLSGGEQQRVAVSRALVTSPKLVLADEPTGNLDVAISDEVSAQLVNYARDRAQILVVATHNAQLAGMCDRVLLLEKGQLKEM